MAEIRLIHRDELKDLLEDLFQNSFKMKLF